MEIEQDESNFTNYVRLVFWLYLLYFSYQIISGKLETINAFIHNIDLPIHEFGHLFFGIIFGNGLIMFAGGNLFQTIFPIIMTIGLLFNKDKFGAGVCGVWVGETLIDASYYISDASARELPLITGDPDTHDWFNVSAELNILHLDTKIGGFIFFVGSLVIISSLLYSFYFLNKKAKFIEIK